jgi:hypothetical protein
MKPEELVKIIKEKAPVINVDCAPLGISQKYWIVEGDVPLSEEQLIVYAVERVELAARLEARPGEKKRGLISIESGGKILRWAPGMVLDYCVWRPSFSSPNEYERVVQDMALATADWSAICGVRFLYRQEFDTKEDFKLGTVSFPVMRHKGGGNTIAMAFFPNSPVKERIVWTYDGYFAEAPVFDPVGVLRHELGHALGFRHEHIVPEAPDYFVPETTQHIIRLTDYDPQSVMHYIGPGVGNPKLEFTNLDRTAAIRVYGHPDSDFTFQSS